jgi:hypothetical protein
LALLVDTGCSEAEALDTGQDLVGGLDPAKGLGLGIVALDEEADVALEIGHGSVGTAPDLLFGQQGEPTLDLVDPGRGGRGKVDVIVGPLSQPVPNELCLVGRRVVQDEMDELCLVTRTAVGSGCDGIGDAA